MIEFFVVAVFGGVGSVLRGVLGNFRGYLPWGILIANTVASALAGWALVSAPEYELILIAGVAGGLSTFSTFVQQTWQLFAEGRKMAMILNIALNLLVPSTVALLA